MMKPDDIHELTLKNLHVLAGGEVAETWQQALKRLISDIDDRPAAADARKLILQTELTPKIDEHGTLETVQIRFQVKDTVPTRKTRKFDMQPRKSQRGRQLVFKELSPDNFNQETLGFDDPEGSDDDVA